MFDVVKPKFGRHLESDTVVPMDWRVKWLTTGLLPLLAATTSFGFQGALGEPTKEFTNPIAKVIIDRGSPQLLAKLSGDSRPGYLAMCTLALIKCGQPKGSPEISSALDVLSKRVTSAAYDAVEGEDKSVYEAAAILIVLANAEPEKYLKQIENLAAFIVANQTPSGSWGYAGFAATPGAGDTSMTQFALLGLWEATNLEIRISPNVFDKAANWLLKTQRSSGGFTYQPMKSEREPSISLTAAGASGLLICQSQLTQLRARVVEKIGNKPKSKLLVSVDPEGNESDATDQPKARGLSTSSDEMRRGIERAMGWLASNFGVENMWGETPYYGLYSMERVASLSDVEVIGSKAWYDMGLSYINSHLNSTGMVESAYGAEVNTAWALLFAARSTRDSIQKAEKRRLGAANMLGGRGLPKNLNDLVIRAGRVGVSPMTGAVEGMLDALSDPKLQDTAAAEAGLMDAYSRQGAAALRPFKDRLIRLVRSPDPQLRLISIWCLSRLGERSVLPLILDSLADEQDSVAVEAGKGLQYLSRRLVGFGPEISDSADRTVAANKKAEAAREWRIYFRDALASSSSDDKPVAKAPGAKP